jgi:hypothetical protein
MTDSSTRGFVYVATGSRYRAEARDSARRLRSHHPAERICLVTDQAEGSGFWNDLVVLDQPHFGFRDKLAMVRCPYERFVFLDTDTLVAAPLEDLFTLLDRFDVIGQQLFEGHDYGLPGVPDAFPEFNTGVLGFRRSASVTAFFEAWALAYTGFLAQNTAGAYHYSNVSDQKSFRNALYVSGLRHAVLGPEYNFIPHHTNLACCPVKILHSRAGPAAEHLLQRLNSWSGTRAYTPELDVVVGNGMPGSELRRLWWRTLIALARRTARRALPGGLRNLLRRQSRVRTHVLGGRFSEHMSQDGEKWQVPPPRP